jgi:hypothetical protein
VKQLPNLLELHWMYHTTYGPYENFIVKPVQLLFDDDSEKRLCKMQLESFSWDRLKAEDSEVLYQFLASQTHLTHLMLNTSREWDSWLGFHPFPVLPTVFSLEVDGFDVPLLLLQCNNVRSLTLGYGIELIHRLELDVLRTSFQRLQNFTLQRWDNNAEELDTELDIILTFLDHIETISLHWYKATLAAFARDLTNLHLNLITSPRFHRLRILVSTKYRATMHQYRQAVEELYATWCGECKTLKVVEFGEIDFRWRDESVIESFVRSEQPQSSLEPVALLAC